VTCFPENTAEIPGLNAICVGEGEYPMLELARALSEGRDPSRIPGLWIRRNGKTIQNPPRPFIETLDELPFEDRDLFDTQHSIDAYGLSQIRVLASRGCPYRCTYCSNRRMADAQAGKYVRFRSTDHLMGELRMLKARFRFNEIFFDDDVFMLDKKRLAEFAERYPKEVGVPFVFCARVEGCDPPTMRLLKKAGARRIDIGVEAGNEALRRRILRRPMSNQRILEAARAAREAGLQIKTLNMVGLPGETPEMHMETVELNRRIRPTIVGVAVFTPLPGTDLHEMCIDEGYVSPEESIPANMAFQRSVLRMKQFTAKQIRRAYRLFGIRVFWKESKIKALGYAVLYSDAGKYLLKLFSRWKKYARALLKGF
jgi:anaerobic magnesium-protoporphyrin IX monomethyl ester cyclase